MLSSLVVMFFIHVNHYLGEGEHKTVCVGGGVTYEKVMRKVTANVMKVYLLLVSGSLVLEELGTSFPSLSWNNELEIKMIHKIKEGLLVRFYSSFIH